jgi:hypothetical protein
MGRSSGIRSNPASGQPREVGVGVKTTPKLRWSRVDDRVQDDEAFAQVYSPRYPGNMASTVNKDKLHDVLDQAVIVIDERDLERSRRDPRVRAFHESADQLMAELEAEGADYC